MSESLSYDDIERNGGDIEKAKEERRERLQEEGYYGSDEE